MAHKILITDGMAEDGLAILRAQQEFDIDFRKSTPKDELAKLLSSGEYACVVIRSATTLTADLLDQDKARALKLIVRAGAGVDNIDVTRAKALGIPVMNTATANSLAAAEQTIALLFSMLRQIPQAAQSMKEGRWDRDKFKGYEVTGRTLGVIGLGNIGRIVVDKAVGLGMRVVAMDPMVTSLKQVSGHERWGDSVRVVGTALELAGLSDVVSVHVPKTAQTANLINREFLGKMKKGSFLINCARGGVVDERAVIEALDSGHLTSAAFDVFEKEPVEFPSALVAHPKVVAVPHLGASTFEAQDRVGTTAARQIVGFFLRQERTGVLN